MSTRGHSSTTSESCVQLPADNRRLPGKHSHARMGFTSVQHLHSLGRILGFNHLWMCAWSSCASIGIETVVHEGMWLVSASTADTVWG